MLKKSILCGILALSAVNGVFADTANNMTDNQVKSDSFDMVITNKIKQLYSMSPLIKSQDITITTSNKNVVLTGKVMTDQQYEDAVAIAESIDGVNTVNSDGLSIQSSQSPVADTYITAKVKGQFIKEKLFGTKDIEYWPISVETKDGVVYLSGNVDTNIEKQNAENLARHVDGVKSINSTIIVKKAD